MSNGGLNSGGGNKKRNPALGQALCLGLAALSAGFGIYGVRADDARVLFYYSKYNHKTFHFHGTATWVLAAANLMVSVGLLLLLVRLGMNTKARAKPLETPIYVLILGGVAIEFCMGMGRYLGMI